MRRLIYDVPRWHVWLHREARGLAPADAADGRLRRLEDELFERLYSGEAEALVPAQRDSDLATWAEGLHEQCAQLPAFTRLAAECRGDADAAAAAVESLMDELRPRLESVQSVPDSTPELRRSLRAACDQASQVIEELREAAEGLGQVGGGWLPGTGSAVAASQPGGAARSLATRLRQDSRLRRIALLAGRFKRIAAAKQRQKVRHGADEISDVEQGADLGRLLPAELARLVNPRLRLAMMRDLTERQCLQYRLSGVETLGKGPLVVCLDKSGSMDGEPDIWATAVALALLDIASRQRRAFALLGFDGAVKYETVVLPGQALPEEGLFVGCAGGTDIDGVLQRALEIIKEHPGILRQADVVLVTDGGSRADQAAALRARALGLGVTTLGVAIGMAADALQPWCDEVVSIIGLERLDDRAAEALFAR